MCVYIQWKTQKAPVSQNRSQLSTHLVDNLATDLTLVLKALKHIDNKNLSVIYFNFDIE